ncbi:MULTISPECIES: iron-sulfur cluster assembly protein [unclassified Nocardioides]|uniref:iron-sulfur cluster assembly protein n=1 Tax=unclassified Nocardioides TaxID=2615069 RepID=UPI0006FB841A|nr:MULTISPECIES: iron-sulfur cluster assembly protein [unclassified Nocardioides]KQY50132.1 metal-sulfur cluster biosynthetic enzyme [Nocardioides sp. Root140]KRF14828.1 metal-sulfur cluster biosynthetic enzyme [Nocardioides sp. Soil796]
MTLLATSLESEVMAELSTVLDPELDEPITDLGFVRSVAIDDTGVTVHVRLPTSFCSPNFAYLMTSDAVDALRRVEDIGQVRVFLDDHHDSDKINAGLAADAGYRGTFGVEAEDSLDELRLIFQRKAHTAAMERCIEDRLKHSGLTVADIYRLRLNNLPGGRLKEALLRRRTAIGLGIGPHARVFVDEHGEPVPPDEVPLRLRFAKAVRISIEGNSHFCRGLLATRYEEGEDLATRITNTRSSSGGSARRAS